MTRMFVSFVATTTCQPRHFPPHKAILGWWVRTDRELHDMESHPDYEYAITETQRKSGESRTPEGDGWEPNNKLTYTVDGKEYRRNWERYDYTEDEYWMRRKQPPYLRLREERPTTYVLIDVAVYSAKDVISVEWPEVHEQGLPITCRQMPDGWSPRPKAFPACYSFAGVPIEQKVDTDQVAEKLYEVTQILGDVKRMLDPGMQTYLLSLAPVGNKGIWTSYVNTGARLAKWVHKNIHSVADSATTPTEDQRMAKVQTDSPWYAPQPELIDPNNWVTVPPLYRDDIERVALKYGKPPFNFRHPEGQYLIDLLAMALNHGTAAAAWALIKLGVPVALGYPNDPPPAPAPTCDRDTTIGQKTADAHNAVKQEESKEAEEDLEFFRQQAAEVEPQPVKQYFYPDEACPGVSGMRQECTCWHDLGTGPAKDTPEGHLITRVKPKPVKQYFYRNPQCAAAHSYLPGCACWYDIGTGPRKDEPVSPLWTIRVKPEPQRCASTDETPKEK